MPAIAVSAPLTSPPVQLSANTTLWRVALSNSARRRAEEAMDTGERSELRGQMSEERLGCEPLLKNRLFILNTGSQSQNPFLLQSAGEFASARAARPSAG